MTTVLPATMIVSAMQSALVKACKKNISFSRKTNKNSNIGNILRGLFTKSFIVTFYSCFYYIKSTKLMVEIEGEKYFAVSYCPFPVK